MPLRKVIVRGVRLGELLGQEGQLSRSGNRLIVFRKWDFIDDDDDVLSVAGELVVTAAFINIIVSVSHESNSLTSIADDITYYCALHGNERRQNSSVRQ